MGADRAPPDPAGTGRASPVRRPLLAGVGALLLALLLGGLAGGGEPRADAVVCATILSTNDAHGRLAPETPPWAGGRKVGGVAALAGHLRRAREEAAPCPAFTFSAGDILHGTPASAAGKGEGMVAAYDALGYDAAALGNHEFDWGIPVLRARVREADFPFLAANVHERASGDHPDWVRPFALVEREGVRVGVVGAVTRTTPWTTRPGHVAELEFRSIPAALDRYIPELRARGADFVVVLLHAGASCPGEDGAGCEGEAVSALEAATAGFDYAITGHNHARVRGEVRGAPVVQARAHTTAFAIGRLERAPDGRGATRAEIREIRTTWTDEVEPDPELADLAERWRGRVAARMDRRVAVLASPLRSRGRDHPLGRLIADAQRIATDADVAVMNDGGIRADLEAGPVTRGDLFRVLPFANDLVRCRLPGAVLLQVLEHGVREDGPHVHVSGLHLRYDPERPPGRRVLGAALPDGGPVAPEAVYEVTVNDFMAAGGSGFWMLRRAEAEAPGTCRPTGVGDLEALVSRLRALPGPVEAPPDPRWVRASG